MDPAKVEAILAMPNPSTSQTAVREFLGATGPHYDVNAAFDLAVFNFANAANNFANAVNAATAPTELVYKISSELYLGQKSATSTEMVELFQQQQYENEIKM